MEESYKPESSIEVRSTTSVQFSLPDVLTDVGITSEEHTSETMRQEMSTVVASECTQSSDILADATTSTQLLVPGEAQCFPSASSNFNCEGNRGNETSAFVEHEDCPKDESTGSSNQENQLAEDDALVKSCIATEHDINAQNANEISIPIVGDKVTCEKKDLDYALPQYTFSCEPQLITGVWEEFKKNPEECFTKGCKWSPDGTCILTNSEDNLLRIFDLPPELHCQETWPEGRTLSEMKPTLYIKEGGRVYDYCWYPFMSSWNPLSCCLLSTSQFSPVHLWDAYTGQLRASYRSYNHLDEIEHAYSVTFNLTGEKLYCGFKKRLSVFHTASPGSACENRSLKGLGRPVGIVSCICVNPANENIYAFSSYSRTIGLCTEPDGLVMCLLCNEGGGLSHIMFSPDGTRIYAGSRNDSQLFCWDMRNLGKVLFTAERTNNTNQRIYFDLTPDGRYLVSGSTDGLVHVWDTDVAPDMSLEVPFLPVKTMFRAHSDCVNGLR